MLNIVRLPVEPDQVVGKNLMGSKIIIRDEAGRIGDYSRLIEKLKDKGFEQIVGVDEAGRGPLAGPVIAAAVILPDNFPTYELQDSKKLSAARRDQLFDLIVASDAVYSVGIVDNIIIDRINILRASLRAMAEAVNKLDRRPDFILVDGKQTIPSINMAQMAIIRGDDFCSSISAASIVAKVTRDRIMDHYDRLYPEFSFRKHKGYPTAAHLKELEMYGSTPIHRRSFRPVQNVIEQLDLQLTK